MAEPQLARHRTQAERFIALEASPLFSSHGNLWYRGTARCHPLIEQSVLESVLHHWGMARVVVGHTPTPDRRVRQRFDGQAILADTGMLSAYYGGQPAALIVDGGDLAVFYPRDLDGDSTIRPIAVPEINGFDTDTVLEILRDGAIEVSGQFDKSAVSQVEVRLGGRVVPARFEPTRGRKLRNELAAFALDRLLGLGLVAPAVIREWQGVAGVLVAVWPEAIDEQERVGKGLAPDNWCGQGNVYDLMYAFDSLIQNRSRSAANMLYATGSWDLLLLDHHVAFGKSKDLAPYLDATPRQLPAGLAAALRKLDASALHGALDGLLSAAQQKAILLRRDVLLESWHSEG